MRNGPVEVPTRGLDVFLLGYYAGVFMMLARPHYHVNISQDFGLC